jgi:hypothetical protein
MVKGSAELGVWSAEYITVWLNCFIVQLLICR